MKRTPLLRRTRLKPMSKKRRKDSAIYSKKRKAFLEAHPFCAVWVEAAATRIRVLREAGLGIGDIRPLRSCDIHHKAGRSGANYLDESTWMAVSREGHDWIHAHPSEARAKGWLL
jgi:hypothetical protein